MPIKWTGDLKRFKALTLTERAKPKFFKEVKEFIKDEIVGSIERGVSPVHKGGEDGSSGKLRYKDYSDSYKRQIDKKQLETSKKRRPVNLKLTGKLLNSLKARISGDAVKVWFTDAKAKYHNELGAGKSKIIRRLLPKTGEQFNAGIRKRIVKALKDAIRLSI